MNMHLDFEKPIVELEQKISELKDLKLAGKVNIDHELKKLEQKLSHLIITTFSKLDPWQKTQLSRHPNRPYFLDYVNEIFENFTELHGDRNFSDDKSIIGGLAQFANQPVMLIGHQKGRSTKEKMQRNFGMPQPEGYRKALRLMGLAERFFIPIITFIDTPGAYPGIEAEERGQAEAIAKNIMVMSHLKVPIISVVIGEGGSGGALAIGVANKILMLEYTTYSVISPESCAAILWRDATKGEIASKSLKLTAEEIYKLGIADEIIPEPDGGAHRNFKKAALNLKTSIGKTLTALNKLSPIALVKDRDAKFRKIGVFSDE
ncbi:MAG TPA: acetyl-CoA carboxylase carboxyltransferase subunit alpha [Oligoflexia bacterium]|nr:acetyl-CoA carboxylase carboxyltransferase subunit alpha [Oligoflexia bacterium]HMR25375.1 acetyl-CoA carboxylase carboxyltransferase subunit alpha [Oligoflexia bacterium]